MSKSKSATFRLPDELWAKIAPLLPVVPNTHRFGGGRPRVPDRQCLDGIFYVLRTGCQWKALDETEKREAGFKARRWVVERTHSWMNRFRRILTRWEKKAANYLALLHFVCGIIAFQQLGLFG